VFVLPVYLFFLICRQARRTFYKAKDPAGRKKTTGGKNQPPYPPFQGGEAPPNGRQAAGLIKGGLFGGVAGYALGPFGLSAAPPAPLPGVLAVLRPRLLQIRRLFFRFLPLVAPLLQKINIDRHILSLLNATMGIKMPVEIPAGSLLVKVRSIKKGPDWLAYMGGPPNGDYICPWLEVYNAWWNGPTAVPSASVQQSGTRYSCIMNTSTGFECGRAYFYGENIYYAEMVITWLGWFAGGNVTILSNDPKYGEIWRPAPPPVYETPWTNDVELLGDNFQQQPTFLEPKNVPGPLNLRYARQSDGTRIYIRHES
jgi:hypothetical protein